MQNGELTLRKKSGDVIGKVKVSLRFDIPEEMMKMLVNDISKGVEHWADRIIVNSHDDGIDTLSRLSSREHLLTLK